MDLSIDNLKIFIKGNEALIDFEKNQTAAELAVEELYRLLQHDKVMLPRFKLLVDFRNTHVTSNEIRRKINVIRNNEQNLGLRKAIATETLSFKVKG